MWRLAWRNLWRNRARTSMMVGAISVTMGLLFFQMGMGDDMHAKMEQSAVKTAGGNVLVHGDGYWESQANDRYIADPDPIIDAAQGIDGVRVVIPRMYVMGLLTSPRGSVGTRVTGVDPELEAQLEDFRPYLIDGSWLEGEKQPGIVLGSGVVEELEIELGDRVVLTATDPSGEVVRALFYLNGVLETGIGALDDIAAYTSLENAQKAVGLEGGVTQIALVLDDDEDRVRVKSALESNLDGETAGVELLTWDEAIPEMIGFIELDDAYNYLFMVVIFIIVAFGIANTFLMAVMERVRELGLLGAIGLTPKRVAQLVLAETVLLAFVAMAIGLGLGMLSHWYLSSYGLNLADLYDMEVDVSGVALRDSVLGSILNWTKWLTACGLIFVLMIVSSLYPAWRASRLDPAQAMRTF